ncbi:hypothetical protein DFH07DRAFT_736428, partial [Mycena maculata]
DEVVLRRLCIMLALRQAYINASAQPPEFDWTRLEFDMPGEKARGTGMRCRGAWKFRIFPASLGVARRDMLVEEHYQCVCTFFRWSRDGAFVWLPQWLNVRSFPIPISPSVS